MPLVVNLMNNSLYTENTKHLVFILNYVLPQCLSRGDVQRLLLPLLVAKPVCMSALHLRPLQRDCQRMCPRNPGRKLKPHCMYITLKKILELQIKMCVCVCVCCRERPMCGSSPCSVTLGFPCQHSESMLA